MISKTKLVSLSSLPREIWKQRSNQNLVCIIYSNSEPVFPYSSSSSAPFVDVIDIQMKEQVD